MIVVEGKINCSVYAPRGLRTHGCVWLHVPILEIDVPAIIPNVDNQLRPPVRFRDAEVFGAVFSLRWDPNELGMGRVINLKFPVSRNPDPAIESSARGLARAPGSAPSAAWGDSVLSIRLEAAPGTPALFTPYELRPEYFGFIADVMGPYTAEMLSDPFVLLHYSAGVVLQLPFLLCVTLAYTGAALPATGDDACHG